MLDINRVNLEDHDLLLVPAGKTVGGVGRDQMADPTESPTAADPKAGCDDQPKDPS